MESGSILASGPPTVTFEVTFDRDMDTGVMPAASSFTLTVDSVPTVKTVLGWTPFRTLAFSYMGSDPITNGNLQLDVEDPNLRSSLGVTAKPIQDQDFFP